jgi:polyribonucleotide nucleotidyltransferase
MDETDKTDLDLVLAATREGVLMVESEAKELSEDVMLGAVKYGHEQMMPVIEMIIALAQACAKDPRDIPPEAPEVIAVKGKLASFAGELSEAYKNQIKQDRYAAVGDVKKKAIASLGDNAAEVAVAGSIFKHMEADVVRGNILKTGVRIDGRDTKTVRPIEIEVGLLPRTHGSALFTRGETQALVTTTLGTGQDEQIIDALEGEYRQNFMLHYNFPPYSVGEAGRMGSPGRREIGHGKLAWRALHPLIPGKDAFPYTLRLVSEITESNGSSSMATVCGSSLALMDAGVPLVRPVAGIAMGLIKEGSDFAVLSDILGDEDHLGDMDFKVAGTEKGVTSLQMDIKITSITSEIMEIALRQARDGRLHILGEMAKAMTGARDSVAQHAPRITTLNVPKDKIREIIGTGGKIIRELQESTGTKIDIEDDGTVRVASADQEMMEEAVRRIRDIVAEPEVGAIYTGTVVKIMDFGAFVNFLGKRDGLVHISELSSKRVQQVSDVVKEGDTVKVKCLGVDDRGKVKLSMKRIDQVTGKEIEPAAEAANS